MTLLHGSAVGRRGLDSVSRPCFSPWTATVPFKANQDRRHHIPKQRHRVTNWAAYDIALRQRGSLTVWFTEAAIAAWKAEPRATRGGQPRYSALAITTALTLRAVFRLALRQTEGLIASILPLLGLDLAAPDHSTMSRRGETLPVSRPPPGSEPVHLLVDSTGLKLCGPGEWLVEKHAARARRSWRKLHRPDASPNASSGPSACPPGNAPPGRPRASRRALLRSARRGPSARPGAPCRIVVRYAREMAATSSCPRCCRAAPHRPAADPRASPPGQ